jgi:hypothetical protein
MNWLELNIEKIEVERPLLLCRRDKDEYVLSIAQWEEKIADYYKVLYNMNDVSKVKDYYVVLFGVKPLLLDYFSHYCYIEKPDNFNTL